MRKKTQTKVTQVVLFSFISVVVTEFFLTALILIKKPLYYMLDGVGTYFHTFPVDGC